MKTQKVLVTILVEVLSIDCVPALVAKAVDQISEEFESGKLSADDGDTVTWTTGRVKVEF